MTGRGKGGKGLGSRVVVENPYNDIDEIEFSEYCEMVDGWIYLSNGEDLAYFTKEGLEEHLAKKEQFYKDYELYCETEMEKEIKEIDKKIMRRSVKSLREDAKNLRVCGYETMKKTELITELKNIWL